MDKKTFVVVNGEKIETSDISFSAMSKKEKAHFENIINTVSAIVEAFDDDMLTDKGKRLKAALTAKVVEYRAYNIASRINPEDFIKD